MMYTVQSYTTVDSKVYWYSGGTVVVQWWYSGGTAVVQWWYSGAIESPVTKVRSVLCASARVYVCTTTHRRHTGTLWYDGQWAHSTSRPPLAKPPLAVVNGYSVPAAWYCIVVFRRGRHHKSHTFE